MFIYLCIDSIKLSEEALQWRKYSKSDKNKNRFYKKNFFSINFYIKKYNFYSIFNYLNVEIIDREDEPKFGDEK